MKISQQEQMMTTYLFDGVARYVATRNTIGKYTLYKIIGNDYQKMKTSVSPLDFDEIIEKDRSN